MSHYFPYYKTYEFAETSFFVAASFSYFHDRAQHYETRKDAMFYIACSEKDMEHERACDKESKPEYYLEYRALRRLIAWKLLEQNCIFIHGSLLSVDGKGVLFLAPSGTGKTALSVQWKKELGNRCHIVNGDRPIVKVCQDSCYGYGSPWCGAEGLNHNEKTPISALLFLRRSKEPFFDKMNSAVSSVRLAYFVQRYTHEGETINTQALIDQLSRAIPSFDYGFNLSPDCISLALGEIERLSL